MVGENFETYVARERARLNGERAAVFQQQELVQAQERVQRRGENASAHAALP
jgi:hypothetical protein